MLELTAGIRMGWGQNSLRRPGTLFLVWLVLGYLMVFLAAIFGFLAQSIAGPLHSQGLDWLYFAVMGAAAMSIGVFCTVLTASDSLFRTRDNELLLSLPIPYWKILFVRMLGIYLMNLLTIGVSFLPAIFVYLGVSHNYSVFPFGILTLLLLGLLVLVIDCLLGWSISWLSCRFKRKSLISVAVTLAFFTLYYIFYSNFEEILSQFLQQSQAIAASLQYAAYPFYVMGRSGSGDAEGLLQFLVGVLLLLFLAWLLVKKSFFRFAACQEGAVVPHRIWIPTMPVRSPRTALLQKEWRRFSESSNYIVSCGLGPILALGTGCAILLRPDLAEDLFAAFETLFPEVDVRSALILGSVVGLLLAMCTTAAAAVSMEGEHLWILKSLPVKPEEILWAKSDLQFFLCLPALGFLWAVLFFSLEIRWTEGLIAVIYVLLLTRFLSYVNVIWGVLFPNLTWTNELIPLKRSLSVVLALLGGVLEVSVPLLIYISLSPRIGAQPTQIGLLVSMFVACWLAHRWIKKKGVQRWVEL